MEVAANASTENAAGDANSPPVLKSSQGDLKTWFASVTPTQDFAEGTLKAVKNTHPAQRGSVETVCRVMRMRDSRQQCLQEVPLSVFPYTRDRLWPVDREPPLKARTNLRLTFSKGNPDHPALPKMTDLERAAINRFLGFNDKPTAEEREQKRTHVETVVPPATHAALTAALRLDFSVAQLPAEPSLADSPRRKRKSMSVKSKPKAKRKNSNAQGKDEAEPWDDDVSMG